jgi:hypothetical protein
VSENLQPLVERWLLAHGWDHTDGRSAAGVLWHHGSRQVIVPDVIEYRSPAWRGVLSRLAAKTGHGQQQIAGEIDRRLVVQHALDAWHDLQLWLAQLPDDSARPLFAEIWAYSDEWKAAADTRTPARTPPAPDNYDAERDEPW